MRTAITFIVFAFTFVWQNGGTPPTSTAPADLQKKIVRNGGVADPEITFSPSITPQEASLETSETKRMLQATEANLRTVLGRGPDAGRLDVIAEVKNYMSEAKESLDSGDVERAHKLAVKARVLTDDMLKH